MILIRNLKCVLVHMLIIQQVCVFGLSTKYIRLADAGHPSLVTLVDTAAQELRGPLLDNLENDLQTNTTTPSTVVVPPLRSQEKNDSFETFEDHIEYIVKAEPKVITDNEETQEPVKPDELSVANNDSLESNDSMDSNPSEELHADLEANKTAETMPVFSEWAQKQLEEAEKQQEEVNNSMQNNVQNNVVKNVNLKHRSKNYASPDCGAKIIAANQESSGMSSVLTNSRDEYALNTCNNRIWFVVELCEPIQAKKIDLANYELFSSSPKNFSVYVGARFPTRDWSTVGQFIAKDERDIQTFELEPHLFGKYIKVEIHSHYGSEHFCPVSLFRVFGTSEFEAFETENQIHPPHHDEDDEEDINWANNSEEDSRNLFGSARDAVMSIVKKAAEVLSKGNDSNRTGTASRNSNMSGNSKMCQTPSHIIVCDNCSDLLFGDVYEIMSCHNSHLQWFINNPLIYKIIHNSDICLKYGLDFINKKNVTYQTEASLFLSASLSPKYLAALCNVYAIIDKKVVLNTSYEEEPADFNSNLTIDKMAQLEIDTKEEFVLKTDEVTSTCSTVTQTEIFPKEEISTILPTENISVNSFTLEISPTKTTSSDNEEKQDTISTDIDITTTQVPAPEITSTHTTVEPEVPLSSITEQTTNVPTENTNTSDNSVENVTVLNDTSNDTNQGSIVTIGDENIKITKQEQMQLDKLLNDLEQIEVPSGNIVNNNNNHQASTTSSSSSPHSSPSQNAPKESILIRLSNRIKALERNMSLSGQYLEELSRTYKKQVEELQRAFDITKNSIKNETRKRKDRENKMSEEILLLQQQITILTDTVNILKTDRDSVQNKIWWVLQVILIMIIILYIVMELCYKTAKRVDDAKGKKKKTVIKRRKSVEGVSGHISPTVKKRRPSTEALNISGTYEELLKKDNLNDDDYLMLENLNSGWIMCKADKKKRKKKTQRSNSNSVIPTTGYESQTQRTSTSEIKFHCDENGRIIESSEGGKDVILDRVSLDEPDFKLPGGELYSLYVNNIPEETSDLQLSSKDSSPTEDLKLNGIKNEKPRQRKLSNAGFIKSALYRSKSKSDTSQTSKTKSDNWEWYRLKRSNNSSESSSQRSNAHEIVLNTDANSFKSSLKDTNNDNSSLNSVTSNNSAAKKEKKTPTFRKMFKKVF